jgi:NADH-quinone oxidoreductase subunit C
MSREAIERLEQRLGDGVLAIHDFRGDDTALVDPGRIVEACRFLRDDDELQFTMLSDMTAVDYLPRSPRFEVVYNLYSLPRKDRVRLKVQLHAEDPDEHPELDSLCELWPIADWLEREIWDMYGIRFRGHPDLRRILMYEEFVGHPLRKDYPKEKRQPLARRPETEIAHVTARRGKARSLL